MTSDFYMFQRKRFGILLGWGAGSVLGGLLGAAAKDPLRRHFAWQAIAWGGIDAGLALFGRRGATLSQARQDRAEIGQRHALDAARSFHRILLISTFLDVGYVLFGWLVASRARRPDRQGLGLGFVVQGLFLLAYDGLLTLEVGRRWLR